MAGISSKAAGSLRNKTGITGKEIQDKEFSDGSGLEAYDFGFRMQDPQIGRWWQIDPLADLFSGINPYNYVENNPINKYDPDGLSSKDWIEKKDGSVVFDAEVTNHEEAEAKGVKYLGKEVELYNTQTGEYVHGNADGTTSESKNGTLQEIVITPQSKKPNGWTSTANKINWFFGTSASLAESIGNGNINNMYGQGIRRGVNGNYQLTGRNYNLFKKAPMTRHTAPSSSFFKYGKAVGKVSLFASIFIDGYGVVTYYKNPDDPNAVHPAKAGLNTAIGVYGVWVNPVFGVLYFGTEAFYPGGVKGAVTDQGKNLAGLNELCGCDASGSFYQ